jgi:hypothetical protein
LEVFLYNPLYVPVSWLTTFSGVPGSIILPYISLNRNPMTGIDPEKVMTMGFVVLVGSRMIE